MNLESLVDEVASVFRTKLEEFSKGADMSELTPELSGKMIEQTKQIICVIGRRTLETFFESYDSEEKSIRENGELYRLKHEKQSKDFLTCIGKIRIARNVYQRDRGGKSIVLLDRRWDMEHEYMSPEVRESILYTCAHNTPDETANIIDKFGLFHAHGSTIKTLLKNTGEFVEQYKDEIVDSIHCDEPLPNSSPDVMVCSLDGVNVLLNEKNENGKTPGRPKDRPGKQRVVPIKSSYKNAVCGTVSFYNIDQEDDTGGLKPQRLMTKYVARMPECRYPTFKHEFEKEILHCQSVGPVEKILLTDAHKSIQGYLKGNPFYRDYIWLLDFFHAAEHLSKLAEIIFGKRNEEGKKWYADKRYELKFVNDGVNKLIRSAEYYIKKSSLNKGRRKEADKELNYFKKNKMLMNYKLHHDNGWPIGSGVVEAACKSIVKQRMCRSGQRWSRVGGQNVLNLRTFVKSERWDTFWQVYTDLKMKKCA